MLASAVANDTGLVDQDDYIPVDNKDLVRVYGTYVARLVTRHNRVNSNFDDLLQHVWMKLFENRVIEKHRASLGHLPKQLTGAQAASYLRISWFTFLQRVHRGAMKEKLGVDIYRREKGVCGSCGCDTVKFAASLEHLRQNNPDVFPVVVDRLRKSLDLDSLPQRYWVADEGNTGAKTLCVFCAKRRGLKAALFRWYPVPAKGSWASRTAMYDREDVERLKLVLEYEKDNAVDPNADPASVLSKSLFKQYLARSVHNIYANWCRTRSRRYQEQYKGNDEATGRAWEDTLGDPFGARQESIVELKMTVEYLAGSGDPDESTPENENDVIEMFDAGKSIQDVARKMNIRPKVLQAHTG